MDCIKTSRSRLTQHQLPADIVETLKLGIEESRKDLMKTPTIFVYGKQCIQHRNVGFFSDESIGYTYSGQRANSIPLTPHLKQLLDYVNSKFQTNYNGILCNEYMNGYDYIGAHSDDERNLDKTNGVMMMSYGASRKFRIRDKISRKIVKDIYTKDQELIQMSGDFQKEFVHEIPIERKIKESRISLTFRKHDI